MGRGVATLLVSQMEDIVITTFVGRTTLADLTEWSAKEGKPKGIRI